MPQHQVRLLDRRYVKAVYVKQKTADSAVFILLFWGRV